MTKFDRDQWLDKVLTDKSLSDKDVAELLRVYLRLGASKAAVASPPQLTGPKPIGALE